MHAIVERITVIADPITCTLITDLIACVYVLTDLIASSMHVFADLVVTCLLLLT